MHKRTINLDADALSAAAAHFETLSAEDTANAALRAAANEHGHTRTTAQELRRRAWMRLCEMGADADFDRLLDKRHYRPRLAPLPAGKEEDS